MHQHHHHDEHDHHHIDVSRASKTLIIGLVLNLVYVLAEVAGGIYTNSLALIADAGHNFSDASGLLLAWLSFRLIKIKKTKHNTYGQRKSSILISLINSLLIVFAVAIITREAIYRFSHPASFDGLQVSIIAGIGVVINFVTAYLLSRDKEKDINMKGAYLHMLADGLVSVGVIISGVIIYYTHINWIDPVVSLVIAAVVLYSTWDLLKESVRLATDAVPKGIKVEQVVQKMQEVKGVINVHHVHIWPISTHENAITCHVVLSGNYGFEQLEKIKHELRHTLEHEKIQHATLEIEFEDHGNCENC